MELPKDKLKYGQLLLELKKEGIAQFRFIRTREALINGFGIADPKLFVVFIEYADGRGTLEKTPKFAEYLQNNGWAKLEISESLRESEPEIVLARINNKIAELGGAPRKGKNLLDRMMNELENDLNVHESRDADHGHPELPDSGVDSGGGEADGADPGDADLGDASPDADADLGTDAD